MIPKPSLALISTIISADVDVKMNCENINGFYEISKDHKDLYGRRTSSHMMRWSWRLRGTGVDLLSI